MMPNGMEPEPFVERHRSLLAQLETATCKAITNGSCFGKKSTGTLNCEKRTTDF